MEKTTTFYNQQTIISIELSDFTKSFAFYYVDEYFESWFFGLFKTKVKSGFRSKYDIDDKIYSVEKLETGKYNNTIYRIFDNVAYTRPSVLINYIDPNQSVLKVFNCYEEAKAYAEDIIAKSNINFILEK